MNVLALDLSLTAPGFAIDLGPHTLKPPKGVIGVERLNWFSRYIREFAHAHEIQVAVIEGYSYGSQFSHAHSLGELGGVARLTLNDLNIPYAVASPSSVKKYATGKGNAKKDEVLAAAIKRSGLDITDNNAADAWWLYQIACTRYAPERVVEMPALNQSALAKVEWPDLSKGTA